MDLGDLRAVSWAVVDVEATGTRVHGGDRVMEIGIVAVRNGEPTTVLDMLVNPQRPIAPFVSRLTGITWEMVQEAPTFGDIAERVRDALDGHVFVGHNVRFDWRFLSMEMRRVTGTGLSGESLCTVKLARRILDHLPRRNLDALAWHYDVPILGRHRAGGDARATARILLRLLADAQRRDVHTWNDLRDLLRTPRAPVSRSWLPRPMTGYEAIA